MRKRFPGQNFANSKKSPNLIPNPPATPTLFQMLALHQIPEILLQRIAVSAGECDGVAYGDAPVFPGEFKDAQLQFG